MKHVCLALAAGVFVLLVSGCKEDHRNTQQKLYAPSPDYATRFVMACPHCGAPQKPYRIAPLKSYYKCTGLPTKFPYHEEVQWSHRITDHDHSPEQ